MQIDTLSQTELPMESLVAPSRLTADTRLEFRRTVLELLESATRAGDTSVELDLSRTLEMDASGLGVLVLLQKRARERGMVTKLSRAPQSVRQMLELTRLDALFELPPS